MNRFTLACFSALSLLALPMFSDPIVPDGTYHEFAFDQATSAVFTCGGGANCVATTDPVAEDTSTPPWTFTTTAPTKLFVLDLFQKGDRFEFFDNSVPVGVTSVIANTGLDTCDNDIGCAIGDAGYSRLTVLLPAGVHSLTGEVIQNALGSSSGAAVFSVSSVPEPGTLAFLGLGAVLLGGLRRFRRR